MIAMAGPTRAVCGSAELRPQHSGGLFGWVTLSLCEESVMPRVPFCATVPDSLDSGAC